uniref:Ataxin-10 domain-containing protein n=1 Tax=Peronospora matthiolae TaxID=2874970 RepID=A0AAV1TXV4_9STRA
MDFQALAAACHHDAIYRQSIATSSLWVQSAATINVYMKQLQTELQTTGRDQGTDLDRHDVAITEDEDDGDGDDDDDDGLGYTFHVQVNDPTAATTDLLLEKSIKPMKIEVLDVDRVADQLDSMTAVFRFLRNACAACVDNQSACQAAGLMPLTRDVVLQCCCWVDVEDEKLKDRVVLLLQLALQFCVNSVTGNVKNQVEAWKLFFPYVFQKLLVECHQHRKVVAFAVALILNCVNSDYIIAPEAEKVAARRIDLVCARDVVITILHRCIAKFAESDTPLPSGRPRIDDQDPAFEWICMLFGVLFRDGRAKDLYNAVGAHMLSTLWSRVTPEQLILLQMFTMWALQKSKPISAETTQEERTVSHVHGLFADTFEFVTSTWVHIVNDENDDRPAEADETRKKVWIELENQAKLLLLDVLGELTIDQTTLKTESSRKLLISLLQELQRVWELGRQNPTTKSYQAAGSTPQARTKGEPLGYRSSLIRLIGNLCFRHTEHQDLVRENGNLPLFLSHCNIDEANPMIREWSLVALRNLCEGNEANQAYINALRPQQMHPK